MHRSRQKWYAVQKLNCQHRFGFSKKKSNIWATISYPFSVFDLKWMSVPGCVTQKRRGVVSNEKNKFVRFSQISFCKLAATFLQVNLKVRVSKSCKAI
jgi:hypothetical protein